jgi:hypothetical protein
VGGEQRARAALCLSPQSPAGNFGERSPGRQDKTRQDVKPAEKVFTLKGAIQRIVLTLIYAEHYSLLSDRHHSCGQIEITEMRSLAAALGPLLTIILFSEADAQHDNQNEMSFAHISDLMTTGSQPPLTHPKTSRKVKIKIRKTMHEVANDDDRSVQNTPKTQLEDSISLKHTYQQLISYERRRKNPNPNKIRIFEEGLKAAIGDIQYQQLSLAQHNTPILRGQRSSENSETSP